LFCFLLFCFLQPSGGVIAGEIIRISLIDTNHHNHRHHHQRSINEEDGGYKIIEEEDGESLLSSSSSSSSSSSGTRIGPTTTTTSTQLTQKISEVGQQKGQWNNGLFSCFNSGIFHQYIINSFCCPQILIGQILIRMNLTWLVHHINNPNIKANDDNNNSINNNNTKSSSSSSSKVKWTFRIIMCLILICSTYDAVFAPKLFEINIDKQTGKLKLIWMPNNSFIWHQFGYILLTLPMSIWGIYVEVRLRRSIRDKYHIPTYYHNNKYNNSSSSSIIIFLWEKWEDWICVICCNCCVLNQMARQTTITNVSTVTDDEDDDSSDIEQEGKSNQHQHQASYCTLNGLKQNNNQTATATKKKKQDVFWWWYPGRLSLLFSKKRAMMKKESSISFLSTHVAGTTRSDSPSCSQRRRFSSSYAKVFVDDQ
jgi:hypothetical protein